MGDLITLEELEEALWKTRIQKSRVLQGVNSELIKSG